MDYSPPGSLCPWDSPGKNPGAGCHFLLQGFSRQGSNLRLLHLLHGQASSLPLPHLGSPLPPGSEPKAGPAPLQGWKTGSGERSPRHARPRGTCEPSRPTSSTLGPLHLFTITFLLNISQGSEVELSQLFSGIQKSYTGINICTFLISCTIENKPIVT